MYFLYSIIFIAILEKYHPKEKNPDTHWKLVSRESETLWFYTGKLQHIHQTQKFKIGTHHNQRKKHIWNLMEQKLDTDRDSNKHILNPIHQCLNPPHPWFQCLCRSHGRHFQVVGTEKEFHVFRWRNRIVFEVCDGQSRCSLLQSIG